LSRLKKNRVGICAGIHFGKCLQGFQVNDAHLVFAPVAGESTIQFGRYSDAMNAGRIRDFAGDLILARSMTTTLVACET